MRLRSCYIVLVGLLAATLAACDEHTADDAAVLPTQLIPEVPANLGSSIPCPAHNPLTQEGVALGRKLFYDPSLSVNGKVSCATCHQQEKAFSDRQALSRAGVSGKPLLRHTPSLVNLAWMNGLFWDGGAKNLESVSTGPLTHPDEMGQDLKTMVQKLQGHKLYPELFRKAFGTDSVSSPLVLRALAQFQRTLISANSRYDRYVRKEPGGELTSLELEGMSLFRANCGSCHATDFFTDNNYHNNGLDSSFPADDEELAYGRGRITRAAADIGKYKTPTLRNVALTAPYMHDGRFHSLEEVLDHYTSGVVASPSLAGQLRQDGRFGIPLAPDQQQRIILFLHTLTDEAFIHNKALSNPFVE